MILIMATMAQEVQNITHIGKERICWKDVCLSLNICFCFLMNTYHAICPLNNDFFEDLNREF